MSDQKEKTGRQPLATFQEHSLSLLEIPSEKLRTTLLIFPPAFAKGCQKPAAGNLRGV